jgi:hypothetical protein
MHMHHSDLGDLPHSVRVAPLLPSATLRHLLAAQRDAHRLSEETAALRREAADILARSRWWRDECVRELLLHRRWLGTAPEGGDR